MSAARDRAWRFEIPQRVAIGVSQAWRSAGLQVAPDGRVMMVTGDDAIRQSILLLVSTIPGERVMRPGYGCHLHRLLFSPNDETTAGLAIHYVRDAIERWEPRVEIVSLDATRDDARPSQLDILLSYVVRATRTTEQLAIPIDLMERAT
jgi:phage baseplate assembly protein W